MGNRNYKNMKYETLLVAHRAGEINLDQLADVLIHQSTRDKRRPNKNPVIASENRTRVHQHRSHIEDGDHNLGSTGYWGYGPASHRRD